MRTAIAFLIGFLCATFIIAFIDNRNVVRLEAELGAARDSLRACIEER